MAIEQHHLSSFIQNAIYNHHERIDNKGYVKDNTSLSI